MWVWVWVRSEITNVDQCPEMVNKIFSNIGVGRLQHHDTILYIKYFQCFKINILYIFKGLEIKQIR